MLALAIVYVGLGALGPAFTFLERRGRSGPAERSARLDAAFWIITPCFTGLLTRGAVVGLALVAAQLAGHPASPAAALDTLSALSPVGLGALPTVVLVPLTFAIADLLSYVSHRVRHAVPALFALHAVHHAPNDLDWRAAARMHPLDDLLDNVFVFFPLVCLGVPAWLVLVVGPVLIVHTIYLHARIDLSLGWADRLIATPRFHRAHHARSGPAANFGGISSLWDRLLGTYRMPSKDEPTGLPTASALPETLRGQLLLPLGRMVRAGLARVR